MEAIVWFFIALIVMKFGNSLYYSMFSKSVPQRCPVYSWVVFVLVCVGVAFASVLAYNYLATLSSEGVPIDVFCSSEGFFNCKEVSESKYSEILGFSVSYLALAFYAFVFFYYFVVSPVTPNPLQMPFLAVLVLANLLDMYLLGASVFVLQRVCVYCLILYVVNVALLAVFYYYECSKVSLTSQLKDFMSALRQPDDTAKNSVLMFVCMGMVLFAFFGLLSRKEAVQSYTKNQELTDNDKQATQTNLQKDRERYEKNPLLTIDVKEAPVVGSRNAPIEIVIFHDLQCGHCQLSFSQLEELAKTYDGLVKIVYMNYPFIGSTASSQLNSLQLSQYSLVAHEEGYYAQFLKELFAHFQKGTYVTKAVIYDLLKAYGITNPTYIEKRASVHLDEIQRQYTLARTLYEQSGVERMGTPGLFLNKRFVMTGYNEAFVKMLIDAEAFKILKKQFPNTTQK